ncbi:MAG: serine hydrolase domain-containing protein [Lachnospiraceae bacterium]
MNIPRQFYGMNYISRLVSSFQDSDLSETVKMEFHAIEDIKEMPLDKKEPVQLGLNAGVLSDLLRKLAANRLCALDGLAVARGEDVVFAGYRPPYSAKTPHITNSTCKTVIAIAIMFAVSEDLLSEEDPVISFFPEYETMLTPKYVKQMTVKHLLTMTSGSKCNEIASVVEKNWVKAFLLTECQDEPGARFVYNSMNTYMLAAILTKVTGESVMDYLKPRFFKPLGINHVKWELCPEGIERGGWGLHISLEGMLKIGMFLINDGAFCGKQLIHPSFIRRMKETNVMQDADALSTGYGYQLWHLPDGFYMLSGMYGQHVILDEKHKLVVATNAHSDKMFPDSMLTRTILDCMKNKKLYKPESKLKEKLSGQILQQDLQLFYEGLQLQKPFEKPKFGYAAAQRKLRLQAREHTKELLEVFHGKRLHIDQATIKLFPYMMQGMYQYPSFHVSDISVLVKEEKAGFCFYKMRDKKSAEKREKLVIEAGYASYVHQTITVGDDTKPIAVKAYPAKDEDEHDVIMLDIVFPAEGYSRLIKFFLLEDRIGIECLEYPDMRAIMEQVIYGEAVLAGNTIDLTNKLPESIKVFMDHKVEPRVNANFMLHS